MYGLEMVGRSDVMARALRGQGVWSRENADALPHGVVVDLQHLGDASVSFDLVAACEVPRDGDLASGQRLEDDGVTLA